MHKTRAFVADRARLNQKAISTSLGLKKWEKKTSRETAEAYRQYTVRKVELYFNDNYLRCLLKVYF